MGLNMNLFSFCSCSNIRAFLYSQVWFHEKSKNGKEILLKKSIASIQPIHCRTLNYSKTILKVDASLSLLGYAYYKGKKLMSSFWNACRSLTNGFLSLQMSKNYL